MELEAGEGEVSEDAELKLLLNGEWEKDAFNVGDLIDGDRSGDLFERGALEIEGLADDTKSIRDEVNPRCEELPWKMKSNSNS